MARFGIVERSFFLMHPEKWGDCGCVQGRTVKISRVALRKVERGIWRGLFGG
jgi:hypothetical protein